MTNLQWFKTRQGELREKLVWNRGEAEEYRRLGDTICFVPIPSATTATYAKVWLVRPELATLPSDRPTYIPDEPYCMEVAGTDSEPFAYYEVKMRKPKEYKDEMEIACQNCWNGQREKLERAEKAYCKLLDEVVALEREINNLTRGGIKPCQKKKNRQ